MSLIQGVHNSGAWIREDPPLAVWQSRYYFVVVTVHIQCSLSAHTVQNVKAFKFYRDLINFRGRGDSKLMLRCINPAEAALLDRAVGARVKFRLGGVSRSTAEQTHSI